MRRYQHKAISFGIMGVEVWQGRRQQENDMYNEWTDAHFIPPYTPWIGWLC